jgi:murein DD-endopeptidase MepM/ murein hydrolase activator NlpD
MHLMAHRSRFRAVAVVAALLAAGIQGCASARHADQGTRVPSGWPVTGTGVVITSDFGAPRGRFHHQGIDLSAPAGTPVRATADGKVVLAERSGEYGRTVLVDHGGGWQTRYAHLKRIKVERGKKLTRGEIVGTVGSSGNASGPHLHYEILRNGTPIDPRPYLGR